ncbi:PEP motif putative anchor domain protein [Gemmatirosa kalamazoonensis]|uniref:PEP motif putative anchor domain protein n=1 Tax=Gemmatirosa kalamazoonensis TaxID=861299 RepID=W0RE73_9BACT|nr:PEP-CTERM sorting domain-containing protein [Gemmatirosa kalamazoonensis]AHG88630.1 PEP motif putative anchor domain protein [Gemmatirosa kalamazoonensis]
MSRLARVVAAAVFAVALSTPVASAHAAPVTTYTFVGSWFVGDGPIWSTNPQAMSGRMTAAYLFGGSPTDYAISTLGNDPTTINFKAYLDGYGDAQYLYTPADQDFFQSSRADGGYDAWPSYSAYVCDHQDCYGAVRNLDPAIQNYAFRADVTSTPEPASLALMGTGLLVIGGVVRRTRAQANG